VRKQESFWIGEAAVGHQVEHVPPGSTVDDDGPRLAALVSQPPRGDEEERVPVQHYLRRQVGYRVGEAQIADGSR